VKGVAAGGAGATGHNIRFLRRVPVDPMTGQADWGMRSVQDDADSTSLGGNNVFECLLQVHGHGARWHKVFGLVRLVREREGMNKQNGRRWANAKGREFPARRAASRFFEMMIVISIIPDSRWDCRGDVPAVDSQGPASRC